MSDEREKKLKEIADKSIVAIVDFLMTIEPEYRDKAIKFAYATALKCMREAFGDHGTKVFMIQCLIELGMVTVEELDEINDKIDQIELTDEIRPQSETLH